MSLYSLRVCSLFPFTCSDTIRGTNERSPQPLERLRASTDRTWMEAPRMETLYARYAPFAWSGRA